MRVQEDGEVWLVSHGLIEEDDEDSGYYAFFSSPHGKVRMRASKDQVWIADGKAIL